MKNKYRIIQHSINDYEAQVKMRWLPFWMQLRENSFAETGEVLGFNTSKSVEGAKEVIEKSKNKSWRKKIVYHE